MDLLSLLLRWRVSISFYHVWINFFFRVLALNCCLYSAVNWYTRLAAFISCYGIKVWVIGARSALKRTVLACSLRSCFVGALSVSESSWYIPPHVSFTLDINMDICPVEITRLSSVWLYLNGFLFTIALSTTGDYYLLLDSNVSPCTVERL